MEDIKDLDWIEIFLSLKCNISCSFCFQTKERKNFINKSFSIEEVKKILLDWVKLSKKFVIFSGGEPTLDKNLPEYIKLAKSLWYEHIRVHTNWFMFKDYDYLKRLYDYWLTWVVISIHWYDEVHDKITNVPGSFNIVKKALLNFEKLKKSDWKFIFDINTVISKDNYHILPKLSLFFCLFNVTRVQIIAQYSMYSFSDDELKKLIPEYSDFVPYLTKALKISNIFNKKIVIDNIPFCVINEKYWPKIITNIKINKDAFTIDSIWNDWNNDAKRMYKSIDCKNCKFYNICNWIPKDYYKIYWDKDIKPIF